MQEARMQPLLHRKVILHIIAKHSVRLSLTILYCWFLVLKLSKRSGETRRSSRRRNNCVVGLLAALPEKTYINDFELLVR